MQRERVRRMAGVTVRCMPGAGATPVLRTSRVGSAALVAPAPGRSDIENVSVADIRTDLRQMQSDLAQYPVLILN
jgi:hypothetical protein